MKKILLDTHVFLWWIDNEKHNLLGENAKQQIIDVRNEVFVSAATSWEISIKVGLGALNAPSDIDQIVEDKGFSKLPITLFHGQQAGSLPVIKHENSRRDHKDPFDRMIIWQAIREKMIFLSKDSKIPAYQKFGLNLLDHTRP